MGNHLSSGGLFGNSGGRVHSSHVKLGSFTAIHLTERMVSRRNNDGAFDESWKIKYDVDDLNFPISWLGLTKRVDRDGKVNSLKLVINDKYFGQNAGLFMHHITMEVRRTEADFLDIKTVDNFNPLDVSRKITRTNDPCGRVIDTEVYLFRNENMGKFLVKETKKTSEDGKSNAFAVAHYYANSRNNSRRIRTDIDIGLSVVAWIQVHRGNLDITVEGPELHPVPALFDMFGHVFTTGNWIPAACQHCAEKLLSASGVGMFPPDESEDNNVPRHGRPQNAPRHITNHHGMFQGDYNDGSTARGNSRIVAS